MQQIRLRLTRNKKGGYWGLVGLGVLVASMVLLSFWATKASGFWFDESYSSALASSGPSKAIEYTKADVHPPLYYLGLWSWTQVFGNSDIAMRSLSIVFGAATIIVIYFLLRLYWSRAYALAGASFAGLSPFAIRYAAEARMYTMSAFFVTLATYVLMRWLSEGRQKSLRFGVVYVMALAAGFYTHYFSILIVLPHIFLLAVDCRSSVKEILRFKWLLNWHFLTWLIGVGLLIIPWLPTFLDQAREVNRGFWIEDVQAYSLPSALTNMFVFVEEKSFSLGLVLLMLFLVVMGVYSFGSRHKIDNKRSIAVLMSMLLLPMTVLLLVSLLPFVSSVFYVRYFSQYVYLFFAGFGVLTVQLLRNPGILSRLLAYSVVVLLSIGTVRAIAGTDRYMNDSQDSYSQLATYLKPGDKIVTTGIAQWFNLNHYHHDVDVPLIFVEQDYYWGSMMPIYDKPGTLVKDIEAIEAERVWLVVGDDDFVDTPSSWGWPALVLSDYWADRVELYRLN